MKIGKKLKILRKSQKMTLNELSKKSGVQIATLSRMENNIMIGTLESHIEICKALRVSLADFYKEIEDSQKTIALSKKEKKHDSFVHSKKATTEMLTPRIMGKKMMPLLIKIQRNGETHKEENKVATEKFIYILDGKIAIKVGKEEYNLSKGDSIYFDASLPHVFSNKGKSEARVLCVKSPPSS